MYHRYSVFGERPALLHLKIALKVASKTLARIAQPGGPRCCKMATYMAIEAAVECFTQEIETPILASTDPRPCVFSKLNVECLKKRCPTMAKSDKDWRLLDFETPDPKVSLAVGEARMSFSFACFPFLVDEPPSS